MAVLVEILSVVIRRDAVERSFRGGWAAFRGTPAPNRTLCSDGELIGIAFMAAADAGAYISTLEAAGLTFLCDGKAVDVALVDQQDGLLQPAPWLEVGPLHIQGCKVVACWLAGRNPETLAVPPGWKYEGSASQRPCVAGESDGDRFKWLRRENGVDVYLNLVTGKEVYAGRPVIRGNTPAALASQCRAICLEVLDLDAKMQLLSAQGDRKAAAPILHRLQEELLAEVDKLAEEPGPQRWFVHFARGLILRVLSRRADAESAFRKANELQPGEINTLLELVRCLGEQGKTSEALPFARQATGVAPVSSAAWSNLAQCLADCAQLDEARRAAKFAFDLDPQDPITREVRKKIENSSD
jgi:PAS domain-containing protein